MQRDIPILGVKVAGLRLERKFEVEIPAKEHWQDTNWEASFPLGGCATVFQADLYAIFEVVTEMDVIEEPESEIALVSVNMGIRRIPECWDALDKLAGQKQENLMRKGVDKLKT